MIIDINEQDFDSEVIEESKKKLVIIDFWAPWCGPCIAMSKIFEKIVNKYNNLKICKINIDENQEKASEFGVRSIPTVMAFKDGKHQETKIGLMDEGKLCDWIDKFNVN